MILGLLVIIFNLLSKLIEKDVNLEEFEKFKSSFERDEVVDIWNFGKLHLHFHHFIYILKMFALFYFSYIQIYIHN